MDADRRAAPMLRRSDEVDALASATSATSKTLADLAASLAEERASLAAATARLEAARDARDAAKAAHDKHLPNIHAAERLGATLEAVHVERQAEAKALAEASAERDQAAASRDEATSHLERARASLEAARATLAPLATARALAADLPLLERDAKALGELERAVEELEARVDQRVASASALAQEQGELSDQYTNAQDKLAPFTEALTHAKQALTRALGDAEDAHSRRRAIHERVEMLDAPSAAIEEVLRRHDELKERQAELTQADTDHTSHTEQHRIFSGRRDALLKEIAQLEQTRREQLGYRDKIQQMLALADARSELVDGSPCPLCGSTEHPSAHDAREAHERELEAERDALDTRMTRVAEELSDLHHDRLQVERAASTHEAGAQAARARILDARAKLDDTLGRYNGARHRASLHAIDVFPEDPPLRRQLRAQANERRGELKRQSAQLRANLEDLDRSVDAARDAQDRLREQQSEAKHLEEQLAKLAALSEERERELDQERARLRTARARLASAQEDIRSKLERAHLGALPGSDIKS
ncbi:MAG: hypothetical protein AAGI01_17165, partial [Myxococcota bacterium]